MPSFYTYHFDDINHRMPLKSFQSINKNRFVININKLFGDILPHTTT